uniref:Alpha/beta hydrolase fold-3 domain-containing protein n=1 Tax=Picea sitchensis TaxID=3332 RepID=A9NRY5_PICSI|nr:unknown [Picea sitchensis]
MCVGGFQARSGASSPRSLRGFVWRSSVAPLGGPRGDRGTVAHSLRRFQSMHSDGRQLWGNLVHEVGLRAQATPPDLLHPVCVRGGISIHPGYVRSERSQSEKEHPPDSALLTLDMVDKFLKLSAPEGISTRDHPITNPMGPDAPPLKDLKFPRMLVAIADRDLIRDTELEYYEAMKSAGHDVEVFRSENVGHSFYLNEIAIKYDPNTAKETSRLLQAADRFIQSCF